MRLRHRLLLLFAAFAVVPLLAMGGLDYARSLRHLEAVLTVQTEGIATRAASELQDRLDQQTSDIGLLADNAETQRLLRAASARNGVALGLARPVAAAYWRDLWRTMRFAYQGVTLYDIGSLSQLAVTSESEAAQVRGELTLTQTREIRDLETNAVLGRLEYSPLLAALFQSPLFRSSFGSEGRTLIIDRDARRVLADLTTDSPSAGDLPFDLEQLRGSRGTFGYRAGRERRVASFVSFDRPDWTLVVTASVDEFADPFIRLRLFDLGLLVAVVLAVSIGFFLLLRRATASLDGITLAADRVGRGDFSPALPPSGSDEVGRLAGAFRLMTDRIREMIAQIETSRQMGVLGRFAAELSHEIRNPLTAIKINLQGLERDARDGRIPTDSRRAVELALREIGRLDLAVKAALKTGRPAAEPSPFAVAAVLLQAVELIRRQAAAQGVTVHCPTGELDTQATGDAEAIHGAFLNLLLNAIEAMPAGGNLWLTTARPTVDGIDLIEVRIRDEGPGIPPSMRDRVFLPFFTTKEQGTGLGLSMALHTIRVHGGSLAIEDAGGRGAEVVVTIPAALAQVPA